MAISFASWRQSVVGRHIDIDGAYGAQCWDLWADYAIRVHDAEFYSTFTRMGVGADSGLASSLWLYFPARPGIDTQFTRLGPNTAIRAGDVVVWGRGGSFPDSHVAIATGNTASNSAEFITQNDGSAGAASGATRVGWLTTNGMLGVLRPKKSPAPPVPPTTALPKGNRMFMIYNGPQYAIVGSGFFMEFAGAGSASNLFKQITGLAEGHALSVTPAFWDHCKKAATGK